MWGLSGCLEFPGSVLLMKTDPGGMGWGMASPTIQHNYPHSYSEMSSVVASPLPRFVDEEDPCYEYANEDQHDVRIGTVRFEGSDEVVDIWLYLDDDDVWRLEFLERMWEWREQCDLDESIEKTLKTLCMAANNNNQTVDYIRVMSIQYTKMMPGDEDIDGDATVNQCIDFPDKRWKDVRDDDEWYNIRIVVRQSM